jgi:hypothetical protein
VVNEFVLDAQLAALEQLDRRLIGRGAAHFELNPPLDAGVPELQGIIVRRFHASVLLCWMAIAHDPLMAIGAKPDAAPLP